MLSSKSIAHPLLLMSVILQSVLLPQSTTAQDKQTGGPTPNPPVHRDILRKLTGPYKNARLSRDIHVLWLYGPEDHGGGEHDYIRIKELFVPLLQGIPRITVDEAYQFPTQQQFDRADLLIQYLHLPDLTDEQFLMYRTFVEHGGRVVSIHESCIMRPIHRAEKLAECIGCSWNGNEQSRWSKFGHNHPLVLNTRHPAFAGLPSTIQFNDESYWKLLAQKDVAVIGAVAPAEVTGSLSFDQILKQQDARSYAFWTYSRGKGKVFGTTTGHYTYTYFDPMYRLLLLRGIAWVLDENPAPFMPIVFDGITDENGLVGTTKNMLDYTNRKQ